MHIISQLLFKSVNKAEKFYDNERGRYLFCAQSVPGAFANDAQKSLRNIHKTNAFSVDSDNH